MISKVLLTLCVLLIATCCFGMGTVGNQKMQAVAVRALASIAAAFAVTAIVAIWTVPA